MSWDWCDDDKVRLHGFLKAQGLMADMPVLTPIGDGHSNITVLMKGRDRALVLRRPPPPPFPPGSNDVLREARIVSALAGSGVPVPAIVATGEAGVLFDVPFYMMEFVEGQIVTTEMPSAFATPDGAHAFGMAYVEGMAQVHGVDWKARGLGDFGRPEGFNQRHLQRIARIPVDADGAMMPEFVAGYNWLCQQVPPESGATIIHNDFRIGNLMWASQAPPRLVAVLDWELATLGDPLMDLAYLIASLPRDGNSHTPVQDLARAVLIAGFPSTDALVNHYRTITGNAADTLRWHLALVNWKLAALYHYSRNKGADPYFNTPDHVPRFLAEAAHHMG